MKLLVFACLIAASAAAQFYCRLGWYPGNEEMKKCLGPGKPIFTGQVVGYPYPGPGYAPAYPSHGRPGYHTYVGLEVSPPSQLYPAGVYPAGNYPYYGYNMG